MFINLFSASFIIGIIGFLITGYFVWLSVVKKFGWKKAIISFFITFLLSGLCLFLLDFFVHRSTNPFLIICGPIYLSILILFVILDKGRDIYLSTTPYAVLLQIFVAAVIFQRYFKEKFLRSFEIVLLYISLSLFVGLLVFVLSERFIFN